MFLNHLTKYSFLLGIIVVCPQFLESKKIHYSKSIRIHKKIDYIATYICHESRVYRRHTGLESPGMVKDMTLWNTITAVGLRDWYSCRQINKSLHAIDQFARAFHTKRAILHNYAEQIENNVNIIMHHVEMIYKRNTLPKTDRYSNKGLIEELKHFEQAIHDIMQHHDLSISFSSAPDHTYHCSIKEK